MSRTVRYVGLDVHKKVIEACFMSQKGKILNTLRFEFDRDSLLEFARKKLRKTDHVVLEATTNAWSVVRLLKTVVPNVFVSNPAQTRAIAHAKVKSDKVDSQMLAHLLRSNLIPLVWQPDKSTQILRSLTSRRVALVQDRTAVKNRIHSALHQELLSPPESVRSVFSKAGLRWLDEVLPTLPPITATSIESDLRLFKALNEEILSLEKELYRQGTDDGRLVLLLTMPGVDLVVAQSILAAIGDPNRFSSADKAASYFGLTPRIRQSANSIRYGKISKAGSSHGRFMMVQSAWAAIKAKGPLVAFYKKLSKRKKRSVAIVAVARKMVTYAWHILKSGEPYRYARPDSVSAKLAKLRTQTGGPKRRTKSGLRPAKVKCTDTERIIPAIQDVLRAEGLPPHTHFDDLPPGEQRMLRSKRLVGTVRGIAKVQRQPVRRRKCSGS